MGEINFVQNVNYQPNGTAVGSNVQPSGNSLFWVGRNNWHEDPSLINQITFRQGTVVQNHEQLIEVEAILSLGSPPAKILVRYAGHLQADYPKTEGLAFTIVSVDTSSGGRIPDYVRSLPGKTFVVAQGSSSMLNVWGNRRDPMTLLQPDIPDRIECFLAGARVQMASGGFRAIEDIHVGDSVKTFTRDGAESFAQVTSVRTRDIFAVHKDMFPVVVRAGAFSDGVPAQDVSLTSEHCVYVDGHFVPARMLVNDRSIFIDTTKKSFTVYHVETENHAIISVDGMLTETLLRTSRSLSKQDGVVFIHGPKSWERDAAAPLTTDTSFVEPHFHRLAARAEEAGISRMSADLSVTTESDLHLVTEAGTVIRPARLHRDNVLFMVPGDVETVRLVSRTSRPCETIGPYVDDRRDLGVLVGEIQLIEARSLRNLTSHLSETDLPGWASLDNPEFRWTSGNAVLNLGSRDSGTIGMLSLQIRSGGPYIIEEPQEDISSAAS